MALRGAPRLLSPTRYLRYHAVRKGFLGGSGGWIVVGAFLYGPRLMKRFFGRNEEVIATEKLTGTQGVHITSLGKLPKAEQKAVWKAVRKSK